MFFLYTKSASWSDVVNLFVVPRRSLHYWSTRQMSPRRKQSQDFPRHRPRMPLFQKLLCMNITTPWLEESVFPSHQRNLWRSSQGHHSVSIYRRSKRNQAISTPQQAFQGRGKASCLNSSAASLLYWDNVRVTPKCSVWLSLFCSSSCCCPWC